MNVCSQQTLSPSTSVLSVLKAPHLGFLCLGFSYKQPPMPQEEDLMPRFN